MLRNELLVINLSEWGTNRLCRKFIWKGHLQNIGHFVPISLCENSAARKGWSGLEGYRFFALLWRHNGCDGVTNHQANDCLPNRLFRRRSKKTSKLRVTGLCAGNSPVTGEFPAQKASDAENVSIWWRHHGIFGMEFTAPFFVNCSVIGISHFM